MAIISVVPKHKTDNVIKLSVVNGKLSKKEEIRLAISQFFFKNVDKYNQDLNIIELIPMGSSYKAGLIAEGKAELCIKEDHHTKEWDTAPSDIIIKEAGGIMKTAYGKDMSYNKNDVINHD